MKERPVGAVPRAATASDLAESEGHCAGYDLAWSITQPTVPVEAILRNLHSIISNALNSPDPTVRVGLLLGLTSGIIAYLNALKHPHKGGWSGAKAGLE